MKEKLASFLASLEQSIEGKDYPEGRVTKSGPHSRFWAATEEYKPHLKELAKYPNLAGYIKKLAGGGKDKKPKKGRKKNQ